MANLMTEDDTFNALRRTPFAEVREAFRVWCYDKSNWNGVEDQYLPCRDKWLATHGWTIESINTEYSVSIGLTYNRI